MAEDKPTESNPAKKVKPSLEMKRVAMKYYNDNAIPQCLENLLNQMYLENPADLYGYMAEYFGKYSQDPLISKIEFVENISSRGYLSFKGFAFCIINGLEKLVTALPCFFDDGPVIEVPRVKSKPTTGSKLKAEKKLTAAQSSLPLNQSDSGTSKAKIHDFSKLKKNIMGIALKICGKNIGNQGKTDEAIRSFFDELLKERDERIEAEDSEDASAQIIQVPDAATSFCPDCARKLAINQEELYLSLLTAKLSADLAKCSLYKSLLQTYHEKEIHSIVLPIPAVSVIKCGTDGPGKLNMIKCAYLLPKPGLSYAEGFQKISTVYKELGHCLQQKLGANGKLTSTDGSYLPNLERAEQVLEFLQQACNLANVEFEEELSVILDIGASYLYDEEKKKYEASTGNLKTAEDMTTLYAELIDRYPVIGFIDGLSHKDIDNCQQLNKRFDGKCFCFGDNMFEDNVNIMEDRVEDKACNSSVLRLGSLFNNITEMVQITKFLKEHDCRVMMSNMTTQGCTSLVIPDLAVAAGSTFIALGPLVHEESAGAASRLIEIENELTKKGILQRMEEYPFHLHTEDIEIEEEESNAVVINEANKEIIEKKKPS